MIVILVVLCFSNTLAGKNIVIQDIYEKYGLPKNRVNCVFQDSMGFMWFGMVNGLYKFDLNRLTRYTMEKNYANGFPEADIRSIIEYEPGKLLVGTHKGLFVFNSITERYDSIRCSSATGFSEYHIYSMHREKSGSIWVGTNNGLFSIRESNDIFEIGEYFDFTNTQLNSIEFVDIKESPNGKIWFLTLADIGYYNVFSKIFKSISSFGANSSITLLDNGSILQSGFGTGMKLADTELTVQHNILIRGISENAQVRYVFKDSKSRIWLSISNIGLALLDSISQPYEAELISNKNNQFAELSSNVIYQIGESRDGTIWLCTEEGISMADLKPSFFNSYPFKSMYDPELTVGIRSLLGSENGHVWMGTVGDGLVKFDVTSRTIAGMPLVHRGEIIGKNIQAIMQDFRGNLWLGTEGEGVIKITPGKNMDYKNGTTLNYRIYPASFPKETVLNDFIMCFLEDKHKNIWIGTWYGLSLLDTHELSKSDQSKTVIRNFIHRAGDTNTISNNTVMSLYEDKQGDIWVGTQAGINRIVRTKQGYHFEYDFTDRHGAPLTEKVILVIYQDNRGTIWFSTQDGGICTLDPISRTYEEFNSESGFHDHIINSISEDSLGILWLGTNNGLCRYNPVTHSFNMYHSEDGLQSNDFFYASNCKVGNTMYFGGNKGLTLFNPYEIVPTSIEPILVFTDFKLYNKSVSIDRKGSPLQRHISLHDAVKLNYNQNYITLEFAALNYKQQKELQYACILEGLETSWNRLNKERKITYTNLKPGHYTFRVKAYSTGNNYVPKEISLQLTVKPPFWKTTLAYITYVLILVFIIFRIYRYFLNEEKKRHSIVVERLNAKRIHEMDLMKLQFYTNISHELRTPLTLITAPLETLMHNHVEKSKVKSYYELMLKNVQRLKRHIDQLLDLRKIEEGYLKMEWSQGDVTEFIKKICANFENYAEKRNIYFTFHTSVSQLYTYFDADKLEKVLFNLLSNAFKYTPDFGTIAVKIGEKAPFELKGKKIEEKYFEIRISDSGIGIPREALASIFKQFQQVKNNKPIGSAGSGIGLSLTKELVNLHRGNISVDSEVNAGTVFTVQLPVYKTLPQPEPEAGQLSPGNTDYAENADEVKMSDNAESNNPGSRPLVLIVEDNVELRTFLGEELQDRYQTMEAINGQDGLKTAINKMPDLVITDVMMDKMNGIDLCKKLKSDQRTSHIPVILLTARYSEEMRQNSYEIGADDYITKPFNLSLLRTRIQNLIEQRRNLRKLFGSGHISDFSEIVTNKTDSQFFVKLNQVIEKNVDNANFSPVSLASDMAMSKMQLYRKVSALTNQTVYNYIRTYRMNKAAKLLLTTDMQISEVAMNVGYTEPSNFTKCFNRQFHQTPSQFVRTNT